MYYNLYVFTCIKIYVSFHTYVNLLSIYFTIDGEKDNVYLDHLELASMFFCVFFTQLRPNGMTYQSLRNLEMRFYTPKSIDVNTC